MSHLNWTGERMVTSYKSFGSIEHIHRYSFASELLRPECVVLDVACGEGYGTNLIADKCKKIYGVDISAETIQHARKKYNKPNLEFVEAAALNIPLESSSVDTIISFETLEHLREQDALISEFKRLLKPEGILIISTPDKRYYKEEQNNPFHIKELEYNEFESLLQSYFETIEYFFQKNIYGSLIYSNKNSSKIDKYKGDFSTINKSGLDKAEFCIAVATNTSINVSQINHSYYSAKDIFTDLIKEKRKNLRKLKRVVYSRKFRLINRFLALINLKFEIPELDE